MINKFKVDLWCEDSVLFRDTTTWELLQVPKADFFQFCEDNQISKEYLLKELKK